MLEDTAGKFAVGDEISLADLFIVPQVSNGYKFNVDIDQFPVCLRVYNACLQEEVFKVSAADNQPDAPKN